MSSATEPSAVVGVLGVLGVLVDPARLQVAGALVERSRTADDVAVTTGLDRRTVVSAIAELRASGLAEATDDGYRLPAARLRELAADLAETATPMDPTIGYGMTDAEREVLSRFFAGRTLTQLPTDRPKRLVVLERLALEFDVGHRYTEAEVNEILRPFHLDVAALRRHLVDEDLLSRDHVDGETLYWRSGGRVPGVRRR